MATNLVPEIPRSLEMLTPVVVTARTDKTPLTMYAEGDEPSFWDLLDVINPLQHIPIISDIYREITGDKIGAGARVAGGALFGGVFGLGAALATLVVEDSTGRDPGEHLIALFDGDPEAPAGTDTRLAQSNDADMPAPQSASLTTAAAAAEPDPLPPAPKEKARPEPGALASFMPLGFGNVAEQTPATRPGTASAPEPDAPASFMPLGFGNVAKQPPATRPDTASASIVQANAAAAAPRPVSLLRPDLSSPVEANAIQAKAIQETPAEPRQVMPLDRAAAAPERFMPLPNRRVPASENAPPVVKAASEMRAAPGIAANGARATPVSAPASYAPTASRILAEEGIAPGSHPLVPPANGPEAGPDWFVGNMMRGLDKYEQAKKLSR